jgi:hypothetical protein
MDMRPQAKNTNLQYLHDTPPPQGIASKGFKRRTTHQHKAQASGTEHESQQFSKFLDAAVREHAR